MVSRRLCAQRGAKVMTRVCIIGISGFGATHFDYLVREAEAGRVNIVAATVINQDEESAKCEQLKRMGCVIFDDYRIMLKKNSGKADLCVIPTGIAWHERMTVAALKSGMNVLVEKPAAGTVQEVDSMMEAQARSECFVAVGYQHMYMREAMIMKDIILDGKLGEIHSIKSMCLWPRDLHYYLRNNWTGHMKASDRWVLDSPAQNANSHQLNLMCFLAGPTRETAADLKSVQADLYRANEIECADTVGLRLDTVQKVEIMFHSTHCSRGRIDPKIVVRGEKGMLTWHLEKSLTIYTNNGFSDVMEVDDARQCRDRMMEAVIRKIKDPTVFVCGLDIARKQVVAVNAAHQSCPVRNIPEKMISRRTRDGIVYNDVPELDNILTDAFDSDRLIGECGLPWASACDPVDVSGYSYFIGPAQLKT